MDSTQKESQSENKTAASESCIREYSETYANDNLLNNAAPWVYLGVSIAGVLLNCIVIWLLGWGRMPMSKNPRLLVINQSIIDLFACLVTGLKWSTVYLPSRVPQNPLGDIACQLWYSQSAVWILFNASTFNLQLITLERFLAIVRPLVRRQLWKIRLSCCLMWLLGLAHQWKGLMDFRRGGRPGTVGCCILSGAVPAQLAFAYGIVNYVAKFAFPLVNMTVCYSWMVVALRHKSKFCTANLATQEDRQSNRKLAASRVLIKTFMIAGAAYILCFVTNQTNFILVAFGIIGNNYQSFFYNLTIFLVNLNTLVNPVIYFAFMPRFRRALAGALCPCRLRDSGPTGGSGGDASMEIGKSRTRGG